MMAAMPSDAKPSSEERMLVNKLSVKDARHLLRLEGGELKLAELGLQLVSSLVVAALTARAIIVGNATVWHLALPMAGEYSGVVGALPFLYVASRHPELRQPAMQSIRLWIGYAAALAVTVGVRSYWSHTPWQEQLAGDAGVAWRWVADAHMQWPVLLAFLGMVFQLPGRVRSLYEYGPPFVSVRLGCAMRMLILVLAGFGAPWVFTNSTRAAWFVWGMILLAEVGALWMHCDIQRRLRTIDGQAADPRVLIQIPPGKPDD